MKFQNAGSFARNSMPPVVFAPLWFLAVGFLSIAVGRGLAQIKLLSLENQKRALYRKLIYEIFLLTRIRRENENG